MASSSLALPVKAAAFLTLLVASATPGVEARALDFLGTLGRKFGTGGALIDFCDVDAPVKVGLGTEFPSGTTRYAIKESELAPKDFPHSQPKGDLKQCDQWYETNVGGGFGGWFYQFSEDNPTADRLIWRSPFRKGKGCCAQCSGLRQCMSGLTCQNIAKNQGGPEQLACVPQGKAGRWLRKSGRGLTSTVVGAAPAGGVVALGAGLGWGALASLAGGYVLVPSVEGVNKWIKNVEREEKSKLPQSAEEAAAGQRSGPEGSESAQVENVRRGGAEGGLVQK